MDYVASKDSKHKKEGVYLYALYLVLGINVLMLFVVAIFGVVADSLALFADASYFLWDSANYMISLFIIHRPLKVRAKATLFKGVAALMFGVYILFKALGEIGKTEIVSYEVMGVIGLAALFANLSAIFILYKFREGDGDLFAAWLCSKNDVISNVAVIVAASAVYFFNANWPDRVVGITMAFIAVRRALRVIRRAKQELKLPVV
ncbi:MAG: cation transporter [Rickettsiales bacterium]